jgi:hypothetical protein
MFGSNFGQDPVGTVMALILRALATVFIAPVRDIFITMESILNVAPENLNRHLPVRCVSALADACKGSSYFNGLAACEYQTTKQDP